MATKYHRTCGEATRRRQKHGRQRIPARDPAHTPQGIPRREGTRKRQLLFGGKPQSQACLAVRLGENVNKGCLRHPSTGKCLLLFAAMVPGWAQKCQLLFGARNPRAKLAWLLGFMRECKWCPPGGYYPGAGGPLSQAKACWTTLCVGGWVNPSFIYGCPCPGSLTPHLRGLVYPPRK